MKKIAIVLLLLFSVLSAREGEAEICKRFQTTFKQTDFLLQKFQDHQGAMKIFKASNLLRYLQDDRTNLTCKSRYFDKWFYLLYKNKQEYQLVNFYKKEPSNYHLPLYLGHLYREQKRPKEALKYYQEYIKLKKSKIEKQVRSYIKNGGYEPYHSKWAKKLNPKNRTPLNQFKNIFFKISDKKIIKQTISKEINFPFLPLDKDRLLGLDTASYHVGRFSFDREQESIIRVDVAQGKDYHLIIDNRLIADKNHPQKSYTFSKGEHKIELEFLNQSSFYNFRFLLTPNIKRQSSEELHGLFAGKGYDLWLVNYGKVNQQDRAVTVTLKPSKKPVILFLQSKEFTQWKLKNTKNLKAVIVGNHYNVADQVEMEDQVDLYYANFDLRAEKYKPKKCSCAGGGIFLCNSALLGKESLIKKSFGKNISTYTYSYEKSFVAPQMRIDEREFQALKKKLEKDKTLCKESKLEKVFKY